MTYFIIWYLIGAMLVVYEWFLNTKYTPTVTIGDVVLSMILACLGPLLLIWMLGDILEHLGKKLGRIFSTVIWAPKK